MIYSSNSTVALNLILCVLVALGCGRTQSTVSQCHDHDFGVVAPDSRHEKSFLVRNETGSTVRFERFVLSCNCLTPKISWRTIQPNKSATVRVPFHAGKVGSDVSVSVVCNFVKEDGQEWVVPIRLSAKVRSPITVDSHEIVWSAYVGQKLEPASFKISNFSDDFWGHPRIKTNVDWLELSLSAIEPEADAKQSWRCDVEPMGKGVRDEPGLRRANIEVGAESISGIENIDVKLSVDHSVVVIPDSIFQYGETLRKGTLKIAIRSPKRPTGPEDFRLIGCDNRILSAKVRKSDGEYYLDYEVLECEADADGRFVLEATGYGPPINVSYQIIGKR